MKRDEIEYIRRILAELRTPKRLVRQGFLNWEVPAQA